MRTLLVRPGDTVLALDAYGEQRKRCAASGVEVEGHDFPVVWICSTMEWEAAQADGRPPNAVPWPAEDVQVVADAPT